MLNSKYVIDCYVPWIVGNLIAQLVSVRGERIVPARDFFLKGYRQVDIKPDEVLASVR